MSTQTAAQTAFHTLLSSHTPHPNPSDILLHAHNQSQSQPVLSTTTGPSHQLQAQAPAPAHAQTPFLPLRPSRLNPAQLGRRYGSGSGASGTIGAVPAPPVAAQMGRGTMSLPTSPVMRGMQWAPVANGGMVGWHGSLGGLPPGPGLSEATPQPPHTDPPSAPGSFGVHTPSPFGLGPHTAPLDPFSLSSPLSLAVDPPPGQGIDPAKIFSRPASVQPDAKYNATSGDDVDVDMDAGLQVDLGPTGASMEPNGHASEQTPFGNLPVSRAPSVGMDGGTDTAHVPVHVHEIVGDAATLQASGAIIEHGDLPGDIGATERGDHPHDTMQDEASVIPAPKRKKAHQFPISGRGPYRAHEIKLEPDSAPHYAGTHEARADADADAEDGAPRKKRHQVRVACTHCQKACKKCSNTRPCERCVKYGLPDCIDSSRKPRRTGVKRGPYKRRNSQYNPDADDLDAGGPVSRTSGPGPGYEHEYEHAHLHGRGPGQRHLSRSNYESGAAEYHSSQLSFGIALPHHQTHTVQLHAQGQGQGHAPASHLSESPYASPFSPSFPPLGPLGPARGYPAQGGRAPDEREHLPELDFDFRFADQRVEAEYAHAHPHAHDPDHALRSYPRPYTVPAYSDIWADGHGAGTGAGSALGSGTGGGNMGIESALAALHARGGARWVDGQRVDAGVGPGEGYEGDRDWDRDRSGGASGGDSGSATPGSGVSASASGPGPGSGGRGGGGLTLGMGMETSASSGSGLADTAAAGAGAGAGATATIHEAATPSVPFPMGGSGRLGRLGSGSGQGAGHGSTSTSTSMGMNGVLGLTLQGGGHGAYVDPFSRAVSPIRSISTFSAHAHGPHALGPIPQGQAAHTQGYQAQASPSQLSTGFEEGGTGHATTATANAAFGASQIKAFRRIHRPSLRTLMSPGVSRESSPVHGTGSGTGARTPISSSSNGLPTFFAEQMSPAPAPVPVPVPAPALALGPGLRGAGTIGAGAYGYGYEYGYGHDQGYGGAVGADAGAGMVQGLRKTGTESPTLFAGEDVLGML